MLKRELSPIAVYCAVFGALILCIVGVQCLVQRSDDAGGNDQRIPPAFRNDHVEFFLVTFDNQATPPVFDANGALRRITSPPVTDHSRSLIPVTRTRAEVLRNEAIDEMRRGGLPVDAAPSTTAPRRVDAAIRPHHSPYTGAIGVGETGWPGGNGDSRDPRARALRVQIQFETHYVGDDVEIYIDTQVHRCLYANHDDNMGIAAILLNEHRTLVVPASAVDQAIESNLLRTADTIAQAFNPRDGVSAPTRPF